MDPCGPGSPPRLLWRGLALRLCLEVPGHSVNGWSANIGIVAAWHKDGNKDTGLLSPSAATFDVACSRPVRYAS